MQKVIGYGLLTIYLLFISARLARAATINSAGAAGVCVAVATTGVTTIAAFSQFRTGLTVYCTQLMNCIPGPPTGGAPAVTPTTGAIGTGAGFPFPANQLIDLVSPRTIPVGLAGGAVQNMDPASRLDCIANTTNGNCCTWEGF